MIGMVRGGEWCMKDMKDGHGAVWPAKIE